MNILDADTRAAEDGESSRLTFDDQKAGVRYPLGRVEMTRAEIVTFARQYDPQPFHLDDEGGKTNPLFGQLSASGWHTAVLMNAMMDRFIKRTRVRGLAGGGVEELRWVVPVFAGDILTGELELMEVRASRTKPDHGVMKMRVTATKQDGQLAAVLVITGMFLR